jgi:hypothetical protein
MHGSMLGLYVDEGFRVIIFSQKVLECAALIICDSHMASK